MKLSVLFRALLALSMTFAWVGTSTLATAQERSAVRQGFTLPADGQARILLLRPTIKVGAQSTGGMFEPNADWTARARENITAALGQAQTELGVRVIMQPEPVAEDARLVSEYMALFSAVGDSVISYQFFRGNRLPTKKRDNREGAFEWTLGPGVSSIPGAAEADYALFLYTEDHFGSTGRKILQVVAALGGGIAVESGVHKGYAGLVDLRTGDLMWLNADMRMGGDVREPEGAQRRVTQLLEEFPIARPAGEAR